MLFVFASYTKNVRLKTVEKENNPKVYYYVLKGCKRTSAKKRLKGSTCTQRSVFCFEKLSSELKTKLEIKKFEKL